MLKTTKRVIDSETQTHDPQTGEIEQGKLMWVPHRTRSQFGSDWFQMAQDTLRMINAHRSELGLEGIVVFNSLMARLDFENFIQVSQKDIANELSMQPSNVSRAMKSSMTSDLSVEVQKSVALIPSSFILHWPGKGRRSRT